MALDRLGDVPVSFFFACPAALFGIGLTCSDVGELARCQDGLDSAAGV